jgi:serine/threonine-protein kinase
MTNSHTQRLESALAGRYKVERKLGEGGMATVYLAEDIKHERKVALKILKPELAAVIGAERFLTEIKTTANLQHPHILPLFDSGEADGFLYYVMPFIDGETLGERLARERQMGVDEAVRIARDVADALDYAHRNDVLHRDIKPGNILLHDGRPVVADFGIAVAISAAGGGRMTETGLSLGTPHYMSPEQASADRDLNARSDVYSLGCVLYEMLAGQPPHTGPSAQSILVRILTEDPRSLTDVRRTVPANVAAAVMKSIEKLPADRFDSAREFMDALSDTGFTHTVSAGSARTTVGSAAAPDGTSWLSDTRSKAAVGIIAVLAIIGGQAFLTRGGTEAPSQPAVRGQVLLDDQYGWTTYNPRISADGRRIAMRATNGIMIRDVGQSRFRHLEGTERTSNFFNISPDGEWVVFARNGDLFKISPSASSPITLLRDDEVAPQNPFWGEDGTIVFHTPTGVIWRVSETGGDAAPVSEDPLGGLPAILPDGSGIVFTTMSEELALLDLSTGEVRVLVGEAVSGVYAHSGHILYAHTEGGLFALPFDLETHEVVGDPLPVLDEVGVSGWWGHFSVSRNGTLLFTTGGFAVTNESIVLLDPDGAADTVRMPPVSVDQVRFSPDGGSITFNTGGGVRTDDRQVWVYDVVLESLRQLSFDGGRRPAWSPDGAHVVYSSEGPETNGEDLWVHASDGATDPRHLALNIPGDEHTTAWPLDTLIVFETQSDLYAVNPFADDAVARPYVEAEYGERGFDLDPTGRFAAYATNEYDRWEIFVRDFPTPRGKWRISEAGGLDPKWSADGRALYYVSGGTSILRTDLNVDGGVAPLRTEEVWRLDDPIFRWDFDPATGRAVVAVPRESDDEGNDVEVWLVVNWFEELKRLTGEGR